MQTQKIKWKFKKKIKNNSNNVSNFCAFLEYIFEAQH